MSFKKLKPRYYILNPDNSVREAEDVLEWGRTFESNHRHIGWTQITSEVTVSTVFLGIDHRYWGDGPPILFETMIFGGPLDQQQWRYSSYDDAETGHKAAVKKARAAQGQKVR